MMSMDSLHRIQPAFAFSEFYTYLTEGTDTTPFMEHIRVAEGGILSAMLSVQDAIDTQLGAMGDMFYAVNVGILLVVAAVVILVLYLIIKTIIIRRRQELGIQKALGFTTLQLMHQIAFNLSPTIVFGVALGAVVGYIGFNPFFTTLASSMGIVQADLPVPIGWIVIVSAALILLSYVVSMLIAWRIRKISAYALITE